MHLAKAIIFISVAQFFAGCQANEKSVGDLEVQEESLRAVIDKFNDAFKEGNVRVLQSMITDSYVHTNGSAKAIGKEEWLSYLRRREQDISSGALQVISYEMADMEIEMYSAFAIVTGKVITQTKVGEEVKVNELRVTNIWVLDSGTWKRAGFHDGTIMQD